MSNYNSPYPQYPQYPGGALGDTGVNLPPTTSQRLLDEKLRETLGDPLSFWTLLLNELQQGAGLTPDTAAKLREMAETRVADYVMKKLHDEDQSKRDAQIRGRRRVTTEHRPVQPTSGGDADPDATNYDL